MPPIPEWKLNEIRRDSQTGSYRHDARIPEATNGSHIHSLFYCTNEQRHTQTVLSNADEECNREIILKRLTFYGQMKYAYYIVGAEGYNL